jgi:hypothetical protein
LEHFLQDFIIYRKITYNKLFFTINYLIKLSSISFRPSWVTAKRIKPLLDTSLESEFISVVTSGWRFLFRSLHFRWSFFVHCLSLTGFHSVVNFSNSTVTRGTCLFQDIIRNITNFHNVHKTTLLTLQNFVYFVFYFFPSNKSVQKSDLFLFKILNSTLHWLSKEVSNKTKFSTWE